MKTLLAAAALIFVFAIASYAQQQAPTLPNQSTYPADTHKMSRGEKNKTSAAKGGVIDLNTASKADIAALPGVGPDYAQTIIDARPFQSTKQLVTKKLIPQSIYDKIQNQVTVSDVKKQSLPPAQQQPQ